MARQSPEVLRDVDPAPARLIGSDTGSNAKSASGNAMLRDGST
jgi:hypothetical protein